MASSLAQHLIAVLLHEELSAKIPERKMIAGASNRMNMVGGDF